MAKSLFGSRDHEGYVGREEHSVSEKKRSKILPLAICSHINQLSSQYSISKSSYHPRRKH